MKSARDDDQYIRGNSVDQSVLVGNSSRPMACQVSFERFGFADSVERRTTGLLDQQIDSLEQLSVVVLKPQVIVPS
jgi:hypothetical protein